MKNHLLLLLFLGSFTAFCQTIQFTQVPFAEAPFVGVSQGAVAFADVDNDGDEDMLSTGGTTSDYIAVLYLNNGAGQFSVATGTPFEGVFDGALAFADVDGDLDQDVLITGTNVSNNAIAQLYRNNGTGTFTLVAGTPFMPVNMGTVDFSDVDNDGDMDVLMTGVGSAIICDLYKNDGFGNFSLAPGAMFEGLSYGSAAFGDIDNDGDDDVITTGITYNSQTVSNMYRNNGAGVFTLISGTPFQGVNESGVAFADVDGDNDQDLLITGSSAVAFPVGKLYTNDGAGNYTLTAGTAFDRVRYSSCTFADVDNDSDQDLLITGINQDNLRIAKLYRNNGAGIFSLVAGMPFEGVNFGAVAFSDIDNDNDQDVVILGAHELDGPNARLYRNGLCNAAQVSTDVHAACESFTWIDGVTYTTTTSAPTHTFTTIHGCDSIVTLHLTVGHANSGTAVIGACNSYTWTNGITYTASNFTATDVLVNASGCDSIVTLNLTLSHTTSGTDVISACDSYTWMNGVTYTASNFTAADTLMNMAGCDSIVTLNLTIPQVMTVLTVSGTTISAVNTTADNYTWIDCGNNDAVLLTGTASTFTPLQNGSYAVILTADNCSDTSSCVEVATIGLKEVLQELRVVIVPNPAAGSFSLRFDQQQPAGMVLTDLNGKIIYAQTVVSPGEQVDVSTLETGVYLVYITTASGTAIQRLVKD